MKNNNLIPSLLIACGLFAVALKPAPQPAPTPEAEPVSVATASVIGPSEPYVVEYDFVTTIRGFGSASSTIGLVALCIWSDGLIEQKNWTLTADGGNPYCPREAGSCGSGWTPLPGSSDGYACRADIDSDRQVDFDDLLMVINDWAQPAICNPHPEIECGKLPTQPPA